MPVSTVKASLKSPFLLTQIKLSPQMALCRKAAEALIQAPSKSRVDSNNSKLLSWYIQNAKRLPEDRKQAGAILSLIKEDPKNLENIQREAKNLLENKYLNSDQRLQLMQVTIVDFLYKNNHLQPRP